MIPVYTVFYHPISIMLVDIVVSKWSRLHFNTKSIFWGVLDRVNFQSHYFPFNVRRFLISVLYIFHLILNALIYSFCLKKKISMITLKYFYFCNIYTLDKIKFQLIMISLNENSILKTQQKGKRRKFKDRFHLKCRFCSILYWASSHYLN